MDDVAPESHASAVADHRLAPGLPARRPSRLLGVAVLGGLGVLLLLALGVGIGQVAGLLLLLICPLLHLFGWHGHGGHGSTPSGPTARNSDPPAA